MGDEPEYHNIGDWQDIDSDEETALSRPPPGEEGTTHSHVGKEDIFHQIYDQCIPSWHDSRKCTFRIQKTVDAWRRIMADLVDAYLALKMNGPANSDSNPEAWRIQVVGLDELGAHKFIHTGSTVNATLIHHGYLGASPEKVNRAFPLRMFEIYRQIHRVCPQFTLDALGKTLTNLHQGPRLKNLAEQLSMAYDTYLEMLRQVDARVDAALKRDPKSHSDNVCAPCLYRTDNEENLKYSFLACMDGNNSLKLVDSTFRAGTVRPDDRASMSFRWLSPVYVDAFKDEVMNSRKVSTNRPEPQTESVPSIPEVQPVSEVPDSDTDGNNDVAWLNELELGADAEQLKATIDTCVERWKAAGPEGRKKMFTLFAISGIFVSVCRHGHVLVMCDMIRSGELMKYPLSIVQALLDKYGADIGLGYDIMSNNLAPSTRLSTPFHRHQQINEHFHFHDLDKHAVSGTFIFQNYRQALEKITFNRSQLTTLEAELGTSADDYESFHQAEVQFFQDLHSEPQQLKEAAEYIDLLLKMLQAHYTRTEIARVKTHYRTTWDKYIAIQETTRCYEEEHNIETQWESGSSEWTDALALLTERNYREALTEVECLVVAQLLELTKLGMSGVGYKLRDKISTALRTRAKAIQRALSVWNAAAAALNPPREQLTWAEVIDMTSLAEFDLLRQTRCDIRREPQTRPANREAMVLYFGLKRAKEEIRHLNVKICRLITFLFDEHVDFYHAIATHPILDPPLATELSMCYLHASRISASICRQLVKTSKLVGFSGNLFPGLCVGRDSSLSDGVPSPHWLGSVLGIGAVEVGYEEPDEQEPASDGDSNDFVVRELEVDEESIGQLMTHLSMYDDN
ncbi:hypothetical protein K438DRAFT_1983518 [Mycena galopus ATCC 62051]|nr:hypothetical protein K438DRAFT_1983518 [Mycena galopus ATCC 62051]